MAENSGWEILYNRLKIDKEVERKIEIDRERKRVIEIDRDRMIVS